MVLMLDTNRSLDAFELLIAQKGESMTKTNDNATISTITEIEFAKYAVTGNGEWVEETIKHRFGGKFKTTT